MLIGDRQVLRITKRLKAAIGYFELGMLSHAMACLDSLQTVGQIGPFAAAVEVIRAAATNKEAASVDLPASLEAAARTLSGPPSKALWLVISTCYLQAGDEQRASDIMACARGAKLPEVSC